MGALVAVMGIVGFLVLLAYINFPPPYAKKKLVSVFDTMVLGVCAFICLMWVLNIRGSLANTADEQYLLPLSVAGAVGIEILFLGVCFLLRNFWVFKPPSRPGGRGGIFGL